MFNHTKRIFVREIIANVNGEDFPWLRANHLQQPEQGFAFVPVDVRLEFVNLFADEQAQLGMLRGHFIYGSLHFGGGVFIGLAIVCSD